MARDVATAAAARVRRRHRLAVLGRGLGWVALGAAALGVIAVLLWQALTVGGSPDPTAPHTGHGAAVLDIGVLVFREGLECVLVLAALTASMVGATRGYRRPIAVGVALAMAATLATWQLAVGIIDQLTESFPALHVQAATGLLAIVVLLVVMNWFFHKVYWTGWIGAHTRRKQRLLKAARKGDVPHAPHAPHAPHGARSSSGGAGVRSTTAPGRVFWGLALLGFSSFYREGFEVVLFLQSYRLRLGSAPVLRGVLIGAALSAIVAVLTLLAHRRLPHRKMLVLTGVLLGGVLLVMVGEQAQEMQLARWLPTTPMPALAHVLRPWMGLWFAVFPTVETLAAQTLAAVLVLGSYMVVERRVSRAARPA